METMTEMKNDAMSIMGNQFFGGIKSENEIEKSDVEETKEQKFLSEIQDLANKAEDELAHATFLLGQASLDPDKWSERNVKTLECNVLKAKVKLLDDIATIYIDMFNLDDVA